MCRKRSFETCGRGPRRLLTAVSKRCRVARPSRLTRVIRSDQSAVDGTLGLLERFFLRREFLLEGLLLRRQGIADIEQL